MRYEFHIHRARKLSLWTPLKRKGALEHENYTFQSHHQEKNCMFSYEVKKIILNNKKTEPNLELNEW